MGNIESAVQFMINIANDNSHGYDQTNRNGPDYDCSSLVGTALNRAGFNVSKSSTTRSLRSQLIAAGFNTIGISEPRKRGDIFLKEGKHVVMCTDANNIVHASINEKGTATGGKTGDQTGNEICIRSFYNYTDGWGYHFRYKNEGESGGSTNPPSEATKNAIRTGQAHTNNFIGANLKLDGDRGPATVIAGVKVLQHAMNLDYNAGLALDGDAGNATKAALKGHSVKLGETQFMVTALKILLFLRGYDSGVVGSPQMLDYPGHDALKSYQRAAGLSVDGVAGYDTFMSLIA